MLLGGCSSTDWIGRDAQIDQPYCCDGGVPDSAIYSRDDGWSQTHWLVWKCRSGCYDSRKIVGRILKYAELHEIREVPKRLDQEHSYGSLTVEHTLQVICLEPLVFIKLKKPSHFDLGVGVSHYSYLEKSALVDIGGAVHYGREIGFIDNFTWHVVDGTGNTGSLSHREFMDWNLDVGWGTLFLQKHTDGWLVAARKEPERGGAEPLGSGLD